jgi:hypothetical protein
VVARFLGGFLGRCLGWRLGGFLHLHSSGENRLNSGWVCAGVVGQVTVGLWRYDSVKIGKEVASY